MLQFTLALDTDGILRVAGTLRGIGGVLIVGGPGIVEAYWGEPPPDRAVLARTTVPWESGDVYFGDAANAFGFGQELAHASLGSKALGVALTKPVLDEVFPSLYLWSTLAEGEGGERVVRSDWRWEPQVGGMAWVRRSRRGRRVSLQFLVGAQTTFGQVVLDGSRQPDSDLFKARIVGQTDGQWSVRVDH